MFGAGVVKAGRSLLLMHRYGLLSSVVPLPSALHVADPVTMEHVLEKTSKVVPVTRLLPVGEEQVRGLQASFLTGGVAHLLVAQYMHAQSGEYVHIEKHLVGEASSSVDHMWRIFM
jgi:xanthine dehydrogenase iron-sulfur cluster and FAD-binding subunit A